MNAVGDVAVEELAVHGRFERGADDHVDLKHGLCCEGLASVSAVGSKAEVERFEVVDAQPAQRHVADRGEM